VHQLAGKVAAWLIWGKPTAAFLKPERLVDGNGMVQTRWRQRLLWPDRSHGRRGLEKPAANDVDHGPTGTDHITASTWWWSLGQGVRICLPAGQYGRVSCLLRWWLAGTSNKPCKCFSSDCRTDTAFTLRNIKGQC